MQLNEASDNACVLKRFVLVPSEGSVTALLYFWEATLCPCHALLQLFQSGEQKNANIHREYAHNHSDVLVQSPLFCYIIDNYYN